MKKKRLPAKTICYYKQSLSKIATRYHQNPAEQRLSVIDIESVDSRSSHFTIESSTLSDAVENKNLEEIIGVLGGVEGIAASLKSNLHQGLKGDGDDISCRTKAFGENFYCGRPEKGRPIRVVYEVLIKNINPTDLIILICAAIKIGVDMKLYGSEKGWYDGGSIFVAFLLVQLSKGITSLWEERKLDKLSLHNNNNNIQARVLRNGKMQHISITQVVVGDVLFLSSGDRVPADGLFVSGYSLHVDETRVTRVSRIVEVDQCQNPFLLSGTDVVRGQAKILVTCVGMNTQWGKLTSEMFSCHSNQETTPLQKRLNKLVFSIVKVGVVVACLVLVAHLVRYFTRTTKNEYGKQVFDDSRKKLTEDIDFVVRIVSVAVTTAVAAVPQGLPLAVLLALAYSTKKMTVDQVRVKNTTACETMASVTVICTDITGTLSSEQIEVTESYIGKESMQGKCYTCIEPTLLQELFIGINLMGEAANKLSSVPYTDDAIHSWAVRKLNMDMENTQDFSVLDVEVESSYHEDKRIGIVLEKKSDKTIHVHCRGRAETIISLCSHYYDTAAGNLIAFDEQERKTFHEIVKKMASSEDIHCLALAHKRISVEEYINGKENQKITDEGLVLLGIVGIKEPCRAGVEVAVERCRLAGIDVKMITGEDFSIAEAIAKKCGIVKSGDDLVIDGDTFRGYNPKEQLEKAGRVRAMARSSPADKLLMVQQLKAEGHVVALCGSGTRDAPALHAADVGLCIGNSRTQVVKENSDVIILEDDFASVSQVVKWGRCFHRNVQKLLQFQLTITVSSLVINFVAATSKGWAPLTPAQLLWVNLIMDTLGVLALATEKPSKQLMEMPPKAFGNDHFITISMWRNIISQALYQIAVILAFIFKSKPIFAANNDTTTDTLVFSSFVLLQVFNLFNARRIEEKNVFEGIFENKIFLGIIGAAILLQVVMVEFLGEFAHTMRLDFEQWGLCIGLAALSWLIGFLVKFIPTPNRHTMTD
ncbi:calcium-transporting ATPase 12, plasma membrane-type-like [Henckelia pumila]|uniref:calcium-transporting ATPase 12, plasma membrane-type-like n=1 Tax=Henckelia pumila TaxID=405737 RepID=UPI003C6E9FE0